MFVMMDGYTRDVTEKCLCSVFESIKPVAYSKGHIFLTTSELMRA